jgi:hypothetical protein
MLPVPFIQKTRSLNVVLLGSMSEKIVPMVMALWCLARPPPQSVGRGRSSRAVKEGGGGCASLRGADVDGD